MVVLQWQLYKATDDECTPINICRTCEPPADEEHCSPVTDYPRHMVVEYGKVHGELNMVCEGFQVFLVYVHTSNVIWFACCPFPH
jgi:hypothetical protein